MSSVRELYRWAEQQAGVVGVVFVCASLVWIVFIWKLPELLKELRAWRDFEKETDETASRKRQEIDEKRDDDANDSTQN